MSYTATETGTKPADPYLVKNKDEPGLKEKVEDLVAFIEKCKFALMTTRVESCGVLVSRCMALAATESGGIDLIFHTNTESGKTHDLAGDPDINIGFLNSAGEWASISGTATVETDRDFVHKYYSRTLKGWLGDLGDGIHDGSPNDPRIGAIRVKAQSATYAISHANMLERGLKIAKGMATGDVPQINKLRSLTAAELEKWRKAN